MASPSPSLNMASKFLHHAERLSLLPPNPQDRETQATTAAEAKFITPLDPVIETANGGRLPAVPVEEGLKLNELKSEIDREISENTVSSEATVGENTPFDVELRSNKHQSSLPTSSGELSPRSQGEQASLRNAVPPPRTHPLFPPLPLYGPASTLQSLQCFSFRVSSFFLSLTFLGTVVLGSVFTSLPSLLRHVGMRLTFRDPNKGRIFHDEEEKRRMERKDAARAWKKLKGRPRTVLKIADGNDEENIHDNKYKPTEGGKDALVCDVGYYARRVGLDVEEFQVQTEDGFVIILWHVYNPLEYTAAPASRRSPRTPEVLATDPKSSSNIYGILGSGDNGSKRKYPVLLMHGLLQSAGAYCTNDDDSLAFFLCKSGYDVWLGNNRCGFKPEHQMLKYGDPRMWNWNIRQMGVLDLPAHVSRVLSETGFGKLGLICHSQGTTETFVALAKEQRPELGQKISVFCALAPAVYAGPLIEKAYFKFMRAISPEMFRIIFGIHAFIPLMMTMHSLLPGNIYGALGYRVFSFLFDWTDERWDRGLRNRMFQFAPVYVSAESMRWWLGRDCFAKHKCILATKDEAMQEDEEDEKGDNTEKYQNRSTLDQQGTDGYDEAEARGRNAWYDSQVPPFALWVAGSDDLVDGRRLLRRFERGREPHVKVVHSRIIQEYEHLDVIWAIDAVDKVAKEVREVVWKTAPQTVKETCQVPTGCERI